MASQQPSSLHRGAAWCALALSSPSAPFCISSAIKSLLPSWKTLPAVLVLTCELAYRDFTIPAGRTLILAPASSAGWNPELGPFGEVISFPLQAHHSDRAFSVSPSKPGSLLWLSAKRFIDRVLCREIKKKKVLHNIFPPYWKILFLHQFKFWG